MHIYHLTEIGEISPPALTPLYFGRYKAPVRDDGTVVCDHHRFLVDTSDPLAPGDTLMIWCNHDYFCCPAIEYESARGQ